MSSSSRSNLSNDTDDTNNSNSNSNSNINRQKNNRPVGFPRVRVYNPWLKRRRRSEIARARW